MFAKIVILFVLSLKVFVESKHPELLLVERSDGFDEELESVHEYIRDYHESNENLPKLNFRKIELSRDILVLLSKPDRNFVNDYQSNFLLLVIPDSRARVGYTCHVYKNQPDVERVLSFLDYKLGDKSRARIYASRYEWLERSFMKAMIFVYFIGIGASLVYGVSHQRIELSSIVVLPVCWFVSGQMWNTMRASDSESSYILFIPYSRSPSKQTIEESYMIFVLYVLFTFAFTSMILKLQTFNSHQIIQECEIVEATVLKRKKRNMKKTKKLLDDEDEAKPSESLKQLCGSFASIQPISSTRAIWIILITFLTIMDLSKRKLS